MPTYVMSDIHDHADKFDDFLNTVQFSDEDSLYIIGDILDRGPDGIILLQEIMKHQNMHCTMGNHEYMLLDTLEDLAGSSQSECERIIREEMYIRNIGQDSTLQDFCQLNRNEQAEIISFIGSLPLYLEITVADKSFLLVHAGLPDFGEVMDMEFYSEDELLFGPHDFDIDHFEDCTVILGHQPTRFIPGAVDDEVFWQNDSIAIDCGCGFGGQLGVLCLETGEAFYF